MELVEKRKIICSVLSLSQEDYDPDAELEEIDNWDSLTMMNLEMEFSMYRSSITAEEIRGCAVLADLEKLI